MNHLSLSGFSPGALTVRKFCRFILPCCSHSKQPSSGNDRSVMEFGKGISLFNSGERVFNHYSNREIWNLPLQGSTCSVPSVQGNVLEFFLSPTSCSEPFCLKNEMLVCQCLLSLLRTMASMVSGARASLRMGPEPFPKQAQELLKGCPGQCPSLQGSERCVMVTLGDMG